MNGDLPHGSKATETEHDRRLRELLERSAYEGRPEPRFKRQLHRDIAHSFRYHRVRGRIATAAVVLVAALVTAFQFNDVGSDGFGLVDTGRDTPGGIRVFEKAFRPGKVGGVDEHGNPRSREDLEATEEALAAGQGRLERYEGWIIGGRRHLSVRYTVQVEGEERIYGTTFPSNDPIPKDVLRRFYRTEGKAFEAAVDSGLVPVTGTEVIEVEGRHVLLTKWSKEFEEFGVVTCVRGQPIDD